MVKIFILVLTFSILAISISAQTETNYVAPVKWERYKADTKNDSFLMPKMPVVLSWDNPCNQVQSRQYVAYAAETVYSITITSKTANDFPDYCIETKKFDSSYFVDRLKYLKGEMGNPQETKLELNGLETTRLETDQKICWVINDLKNNEQWFELWAGGEDKTKSEIKRFIESVKTKTSNSAIEIGKGSSRILGDESISAPKPDKVSKIETTGNKVKSLRLFFKPRANYTDTARDRQTVGVVRVRVTFLANGGIGAVTLVNDGLPNGLTEQAIAAAQKIAFIPQKANDTPVSVTKVIEYSFSIY